MSIADWLAAARADAEAAQRDGGWYSMLDLRGTYDMHGIDAAHIVRFSPDVALRLLDVVEQVIRDSQDPIHSLYQSHDLEAAIDALRVAVEGAGE